MVILRIGPALTPFFSLSNAQQIALSNDRISLTKKIMADNGILLAPDLEKHVDTDFNLGEIEQPASAVPSAAASVASVSAASVSAASVSAASVASGGGDEAEAASSANPSNNSGVDADMAVPKIVAAGKGGALYMPAIFSKVIELSGEETPNIVYLGTASFDADKNAKRHGDEFRKIGCEVQRLDVSEPQTVPSAEEMRRLVVDWADVIVCSGGNTLHALVRWKETGLDLLLKEAAENGAVLCGGSAGAGCWFNSMHSDSLRPDNVKHGDVVKSVLDEEELEDWVSS